MKLTKLEEYVWANQNSSAGSIANHLNRTEASISRAYASAERKMKEAQARQGYIDQIIHAQTTFTDDSKLVIELRKALAAMNPVALGQLAVIVGSIKK